MAAYRMTEEEYLALDGLDELPVEFVNGEALPIEGASEAHNIIVRNLIVATHARLRPSGCRAYTSQMRVRIAATGMYAYPDVVIVCGRADFAPTKPESLLNPRAVIEVHSPSTEDYDRGAKAAHYRRVPTVDAVVLVDSRTRTIEVQTRNPNGTWTLDERTEGNVSFLGIELPFDEVYADADVAMARAAGV